MDIIESLGDTRERTSNDRAAALEAKYDPDDDIAMRRLGAPIEGLKDSKRTGDV